MILSYRFYSLKIFMTIGLLLCLACPSWAQSASWKTKFVRIDCKECSLPQALGQFAQQTGVSILAEGVPTNLPLVLTTQGNADTVLTQITAAFDYAWHVSKNGLIMLTRRFTDEHEQPEINIAELHASIQDLLRCFQALYTQPQGSTRLSDAFRRFAANLPPDEQQNFNAGKEITISSLSPPLQAQAISIIYQKEFGRIPIYLERLDHQLQALPTAQLASKDVLFEKEGNRTAICLLSNPITEGTPHMLWFPQQNEDKAAAPPSPGKTPGFMPPAGWQAAYSIQQAFSLLKRQAQITATISPLMQNKRFFLLMKDSDAPRVLPALAELESFGIQKKVGADPNAYFLYRPGVDTPRDTKDLSRAIMQVLPHDIMRSLSARPKTIDGQKVYDPHDLFPELPPYSGRSLWGADKLRVQEKSVSTKLQHSFPPGSFAHPIPYKSLTEEQKQDLSYLLFCQQFLQISPELWSFVNQPGRYLTDPLSAHIFRTNDGYGISSPPNGGRFIVTEGIPAK